MPEQDALDLTVETGDPSTHQPESGDAGQQVDATGASETVAETDQQKNEREARELRGRQEKHAKGVQKRFDELTADKHAERRRAENAEREAEAYRQQVARQTQQQRGPDPNAQPKRSDYGSYEDFLDARADFRARVQSQKIVSDHLAALGRQTAETQIQAQARDMVQTFEKRHAAESKTIPNYEKTVSESEVVLAPHVAMAVAQSETPAKLIHYLALHPEVAERLNVANPVNVAREIGRTEAGFGKSPQMSNAPSPGTPVGGKGGSGSAADNPPEDGEAYQAWAKKYLK